MVSNAEYLNQIAAENRALKAQPVKTFGNINISPNMIKWGIIGTVAFFVILFIGSLLSGGTDREKELIDQIVLRTSNISTSINNYNPHVKSSDLRSMSTSLSAVLSEVNLNLTNYKTENYPEDKSSESDPLYVSETEFNAILVNDLEVARLSGRLDRIYAREYSYQISMLLSLESELYSRTDSTQLQSYLTSSTNNLKLIQSQLDSYSSPAD